MLNNYSNGQFDENGVFTGDYIHIVYNKDGGLHDSKKELISILDNHYQNS